MKRRWEGAGGWKNSWFVELFMPREGQWWCPDTELVVRYGSCHSCSWLSDTRLITCRYLADHNLVGTIPRVFFHPLSCELRVAAFASWLSLLFPASCSPSVVSICKDNEVIVKAVQQPKTEPNLRWTQNSKVVFFPLPPLPQKSTAGRERQRSEPFFFPFLIEEMSQTDLRRKKCHRLTFGPTRILMSKIFILDFGELTHVIDTAVLTSISWRSAGGALKTKLAWLKLLRHMDRFDSNIHTQCDKVYVDRQFDCRG